MQDMLLEQGVCVLLRTGLFRAYFMFCSSLIMILTKFYLSVQRSAIPTNSIKSVPWMINIFGLTVNYQWGFPLACCASIEELTVMSNGKQMIDSSVIFVSTRVTHVLF